MMSRNTYLISGTAALVVFGGGLMFWQMPSGDSTPDEPVRVLTQPAKPQAVLPAAAPQPNAPEPAFSDLTLRYRNAKDFRIFMQYLKQHPEQGGSYYAIQVRSICSSDALQKQSALPFIEKFRDNYAQRAADFSRLKTLCQSFSPQELEMQKFQQDYADVFKKDQLLKLFNQTTKPGQSPVSEADRIAFKKALLESTDAVFHQSMGQLLNSNRTADGKREYWINGTRITPEDKAAYFDMLTAFGTVGYELGLAADGTDPVSMIFCIESNMCFRNPDEFVRIAYQRENPQLGEDRIQRVIQWRKQIGAAILAKDVAFFLPR